MYDGIAVCTDKRDERLHSAFVFIIKRKGYRRLSYLYRQNIWPQG